MADDDKELTSKRDRPEEEEDCSKEDEITGE